MGEIVKRKKKGRPSKADLALRSGVKAAPAEPFSRRSLRRRNVRYNIDYDDFIDEDYEDEEEDERKRKLKLKLVVKLNQGRDEDDEEAETELNQAQIGSRGTHAQEYGLSASEEDESDRRPLKKKRIGRGNQDYEEYDCDENRGEDVDEDEEDDDCAGERGRSRVGSKGSDSVPGTPSDLLSGVPLPDKKTMELILDKLQKKDIYGVYAEPVDPEELPDYHEIIEHPMDFATLRKKLANGAYSTLEQFASDVFLICSNAMQYNAPDTIYHKQAYTIQELAKRKFERLRVHFECSEKEVKIEQKTKPNLLVKKQIKKPSYRPSQEPIGSDFSSGATLATTGDVQNSSNPIQGGSCERPNHTDGIVENNSSPFDTNLEKAEDLSSGKGLLSRLGRKTVLLDENRRATYNISQQPVVKSESIFTTFDGESRQLVAVGLHAEYSYARSLARFAATLGPVAWKVASKRIEQALPDECKFGRGWVGEYEPLPIPVLMIEKDDRFSMTPFSTRGHPVNGHNCPDGKAPFFSSGGTYITPVTVVNQQPNQLSNSYAEPEKKMKKQFELNSLPSPNQNNSEHVEKHFQSNSHTVASSRSQDLAPMKMKLQQSASFKLPSSNGVSTGGFPNGKVVTSCLNNQKSDLSSESISSQIARPAAWFSHGQDQGLTDPVQLMRMLAEKAQRQQNSSNQAPLEAPPVMPTVSRSIKNEESNNNASAAAARAWMSVGAGGFKRVAENFRMQNNHISADSLYNPAREFHHQISLGQGESSPLVFPQLAPTELSRFQVKSSWRGLSPHVQNRQKQDMLPPDLNIGFQFAGSPVRQSSGVQVDSQQPDLALQL